MCDSKNQFRAGELFAEVDAHRFIFGGEDAEAADFSEAGGENVQEESADEFVRRDSHEFHFVAVGFVAIPRIFMSVPNLISNCLLFTLFAISVNPPYN